MSSCQRYVDMIMPRVREMIHETQRDWRERAAGFSQNYVSPMYLGDCNDVVHPEIRNQIGTVHLHTIDFSRPSPEDYKTFSDSSDKYMCYARPMEGMWNVRCFDRDFAICGENEL
jgi:hypothetical protein